MRDFIGSNLIITGIERRNYVYPYGDAEAARYDNPVASRRWILELLEEIGRPLDYEEIVV